MDWSHLLLFLLWKLLLPILRDVASSSAFRGLSWAETGSAFTYISGMKSTTPPLLVETSFLTYLKALGFEIKYRIEVVVPTMNIWFTSIKCMSYCSVSVPFLVHNNFSMLNHNVSFLKTFFSISEFTKKFSWRLGIVLASFGLYLNSEELATFWTTWSLFQTRQNLGQVYLLFKL